MLKKIFACAIVLAFNLTTNAQDTTVSTAPKPTISGYVDVYYRYNLSNPKRDKETFNNYTSFTNSHNSFEFNMASLKLEHSYKKVGMVADIGFGKRAEEFSYVDDATRFIIKQAYLTYSPLDNVTFTAGSWATHVGYELVDPYANKNYSMSYMFSKGPFFHTGLKAEASLGKSGFMVGVTNPTDLKSASFAQKFLIAQYSITNTNENVSAYINYQGGNFDHQTRMKQLDLTVTSTFGKYGIGYNGTITSLAPKVDGKYIDPSAWWGSALYLNADPFSWLGFTLRGEYFNDDKTLTDVFSGVDPGGSVFATTLSANFKIDNLTIIPELRFDKANREIFINNSGLPIRNMSTALIAAIYKF